MDLSAEREKVLLNIQNDVLKGGICVQDWTTFQLENAYIAFCAGADLACILMCQAAIESYMRDDEGLKNRSFYDLNGFILVNKKIVIFRLIMLNLKKWHFLHID